MSEDKKVPTEKDLININAGKRNAFLKKLAFDKYPSANGAFQGRAFNTSAQDISKNSDPSYTLPQTTESFDLWVTEINYGYGLTGSNAASRFYNRFYPQYFRKNPIQVKGVCRDEVEYNDLAKFIREQQVNATIDHNNLFLLQIPGGGIRSIGVVSSFQSGISVQNQGIPIAPEFNFEFIVFRDLTDAFDSQYNGNTKFSYFKNSSTIEIDTGRSPAIFSTDAGSIKPFNPKKRPSAPLTDPTDGINGGTDGAKGS